MGDTLSERDKFLASIANTIADYRAGEIARPSAEHVDRWVAQFDRPVQMPLLKELDHVLRKTYLTRAHVEAYLRQVVAAPRLLGVDAAAYWRRRNFLRIQQNGNSQVEMLKLLAPILKADLGLDIGSCGHSEGDDVYLDDILFSGQRVTTDLAAYFRSPASKGKAIHIVLIAAHTFGKYTTDERLDRDESRIQQSACITWDVGTLIENRRGERDTSEVLWPASLPRDDEVQRYVEQERRYPFMVRSPGGNLGAFSSEAGRQLLEQQFLLAGMRIRSRSANPKAVMRPLGYSGFGLGFGAINMTYRNCPNNCPLALWWGNTALTQHSLGSWYPLLPRKPYVTMTSSTGPRQWPEELSDEPV